MTNTQLRIVSALILLSAVGIIAYLGFVQLILFIFVAGLLCVDEIYVNFLKKNRTITYYISQALFGASFLLINIYYKSYEVNVLLAYLALVVNFFLMLYLFKLGMQSEAFINLFKKIPLLIVFLVYPHVSAISSLLYYGNWIRIISVFLVICISMDTGAWFFGKNFGKRKLWPSVSPNKTIEGLIGGTLTAGVVSSGLWFSLTGSFKFSYFIFFALIGLLSQMGDLIQSKFKRQAKIKDSSSLIPGHGGIYDRIDSIIFAVPFYAVFIHYLNY